MKGTTIKAIHIMADGTVRDSIDGVVITNDEFYTVLNAILRERGKELCKKSQT